MTTESKIIECGSRLFRIICLITSSFVIQAKGHATPLAAGVAIHGWTILSDSEPDAMAVIARGPAYQINQLELSQAMVGSLRELQDEKRQLTVCRLVAAAHAAGIAEVTVADNALYNLDYYPERFRTGPGGTLDLDNTAFWQWFKDDYRALLDRVPAVDGVVLSFIASPGRPDLQSSQQLTSGALKLAALLNAVADVVVGERHLNLYARLYPNEIAGDPCIKELVDHIARPEVRLMSKFSPMDYFLTGPNNASVGAYDRPTIVEWDAVGEFNGQGVVANTWVEDIMRRYREVSVRSHVIGYTARVDRFVSSRLIGRPGEINLLALKRAAEDPDVTAKQVYAEFIDERYGVAARPDVEAAFKNAYDIASSVFYVLGLPVNDHSRLDYDLYTESYGHNVIGRWLNPPVFWVGHGVDREFHCYRNILDHIAPAFVKDPRYVPPAYVPGSERRWIHPGEAMDEEYLRYILTEKDFGVSSAEDSLQHIDNARSKLASGAYDELHNYFERTLLTARLHRAVAAVYYGFRVWSRGEPYRSAYVYDVVQNGLTSSKEVVRLIRDFPVPPQSAEYEWAKDADRAERYLRLITQDGWLSEDPQGQHIPDPAAGLRFSPKTN